MKRHARLSAALAVAGLFLASCTDGGALAKRNENSRLLQGPPIEDIVTPFDEALMCLKPRMNKSVTFSVGVVADQTGRQSIGETGGGTYFTQGAGEMIQSAMLRAGATVVNRRNMDIPVTEARWGIRGLENLAPTTFYISGSISSLDFVPGGGFSAALSGVGPRYRQNRILVGADLYMTDARTGLVVGYVPVQKQLVASEVGFGVGRFFGSTLANADTGLVEREALNFVLRQMLSLATFELVSMTMEPRHWLPCRAKLNSTYGRLAATQGAEVEKLVLEELERLRTSDPKAAMILERELAGESIEDIMKSLGEPLPEAPKPKPAAATPPAPAAQAAPSPAPSAAAQPPAAVTPPPPDEVARTTGPLVVGVTEGDVFTRVTVEAPPGADLRWGFSGENLLVVAMAHSGSFDLSNVTNGITSSRVAGMLAGGNAARQALQVRLTCRDCGAFGEVSDQGVLTLDIAQSEERTPIDLTPRAAMPPTPPPPPAEGPVQGGAAP